MKIDLTKAEVNMLKAYHFKHLANLESGLVCPTEDYMKKVNGHIIRLKLLGVKVDIKNNSFTIED